MAWLAVLSDLPWSKIVENAPLVADGATRLIGSVRGSRKALADTGTQIDKDTLVQNVSALEDAVLTLNQQVTNASELTRDAAEANKSLISMVAFQRGLINLLLVATAISWIALIYLLTR